MTAALGVLVGVLLFALVLVLVAQQRTARRLLAAGRQLADEVVASGSGLAEATSVIERVVDRTLTRGQDVSIAEARLVRALGAIPQGVVVFDAQQQIVFRNRSAAGYLAVRHSEALVEEAITDLARNVIEGAAAAPTRTVDLFGPPRRTVVVQGLPLDHAGEEVGALVVIEDITERRRLEAIRRDFVANISHELKTPVGALGLLAETFVAEDDPAVARRLAERMLHESFRVARTIDDLLELSRIEGDDRATREEIAIDACLTEAAERVSGAAEQRGISVQVEPPSPGLAVRGDRRQLVSALYNLLDNAVKYSESGSTVQVSARGLADSVEIAVEDHGVGIPRRDLERVFERFYRVDQARSRETGGTGLGLAIVRHVASNLDGEVHVESREGEGSTFTLRLPAWVPDASGTR
ncbi:MAG: sensor histidine kinase [Microthrixaceae bacterium]